jgi:hypothetical protein
VAANVGNFVDAGAVEVPTSMLDETRRVRRP